MYTCHSLYGGRGTTSGATLGLWSVSRFSTVCATLAGCELWGFLLCAPPISLKGHWDYRRLLHIWLYIASGGSSSAAFLNNSTLLTESLPQPPYSFALLFAVSFLRKEILELERQNTRSLMDKGGYKRTQRGQKSHKETNKA